MNKKQYSSPLITKLGTVQQMTQAAGNSSHNDLYTFTPPIVGEDGNEIPGLGSHGSRDIPYVPGQ